MCCTATGRRLNSGSASGMLNTKPASRRPDWIASNCSKLDDGLSWSTTSGWRLRNRRNDSGTTPRHDAFSVNLIRSVPERSGKTCSPEVGPAFVDLPRRDLGLITQGLALVETSASALAIMHRITPTGPAYIAIPHTVYELLRILNFLLPGNPAMCFDLFSHASTTSG